MTRKEAIQELRGYKQYCRTMGFRFNDWREALDMAIEALSNNIDNTPTVNVVKVKCGEWLKENIILTSYPPQYRWHCSNCGKAKQGFNDSVLTNFCPNCGADMRERMVSK